MQLMQMHTLQVVTVFYRVKILPKYALSLDSNSNPNFIHTALKLPYEKQNDTSLFLPGARFRKKILGQTSEKLRIKCDLGKC